MASEIVKNALSTPTDSYAEPAPAAMSLYNVHDM
jgi:hypothetical protein